MRNYWRIAELLWVSLLGLPIIVPGKLIPLNWHSYLVLAALVFPVVRWLVWWIAKARNGETSPSQICIHPLSLSLLVFLLCFPASLWVSVDRTVSWVAAGYILWGVALFDTLTQWPLLRQRTQFAAWGFITAGTLLAILVLPLVNWKAEFRLFYLPLYEQLTALNINVGETIHANILASVLALVLPLAFALTLQTGATRRERLMTGSVFLIAFVILILTQSRGAYFALLVALPLVAILRWPKLLYVTIVVIPILVLIPFYFGTISVLDLLSRDGSLGGWDVRIDIWSHSLQAIYDFVFTGIGFGTFTKVMPLLYPLKYPIEGYPHAHNLFLQIGVDLGVGGLVAYCAILFVLFAMLWRSLRTFSRQSNEWMLAVGSLGSLIAMLVHGLLDAATWISKIAFFPWILFALITLLFLKAEEKRWQVSNENVQ